MSSIFYAFSVNNFVHATGVYVTFNFVGPILESRPYLLHVAYSAKLEIISLKFAGFTFDFM